MAGVLSKIAAGAKGGAKESVQSLVGGRGAPAGGLIGSIFRGAVGGLLQKSAIKTDSSETVNAQIHSLVPYFANITENIQLIAYEMGAAVTVMKDIKDDAKSSIDKAARAKEEAETEKKAPDATPETATPTQEEKDTDNGEEKSDSAEKKEATDKFAGLDLEGVVKAFGSMIGEGLVNLGIQGITKLFPATLIASLVAAIGYGVYKYFTDDEFKKSVDDAFSTAKKFVMEEVFTPFIDGIKTLINGALEFLGGVWNWVVGIVDRGAAWIAEKLGIDYEGAKKAVKETAKAAATKVASGAKKITGAVVGFFTGSKPTAPPLPPSTPQAAPASPSGSIPTASSQEGAATPAPSTPPSAPEPAASTPTPANVDKDVAQAAEGTPQGDASKFESLVKKADPGVVLSGFHEAFKARLAGLAEEFQRITGKKLTITSGFRTREKQEQLYKEKHGVGVAKPGTSLHESGVAIDIDTADANKAAQLGLLDKYKLIRPLLNWGVKPEPWHVEPVERKGLKTAPDGNFVAGGNGKATDPSSGKAIQQSPDTGTQLASASTSVAAATEEQAKSGGKTIVINNQKINNTQAQIIRSGGVTQVASGMPASVGA